MHAMAKELATFRGSSVTDAVRERLNVELERPPNALSQANMEGPKVAIDETFRRSALPEWQGGQLQKTQSHHL